MCDTIDLFDLIANSLDEYAEPILRQPENHISSEFCEQLLKDEIQFEKHFFDEIKSVDEHNYTEKSAVVNAIEVNKGCFQLKAKLIKMKKMKQQRSLTLSSKSKTDEGEHNGENEQKSKVTPLMSNDRLMVNRNGISTMKSINTRSHDQICDYDTNGINFVESGLDRGLIPDKIVAMQEYNGIILHLVQWTDVNEEMEAIPSTILSAKYPQVVIDFYESMAVMCNIYTGEEAKINF